MKSNVLLAYRREGVTFTGRVDDDKFIGLTYGEMMFLAQAALLKDPDSGLRLLRVEREDLLPVQLEPALLDLLRRDLPEYVCATTVPDRIVTLSPGRRIGKLAAAYVIPRGGLRVGHDTLAAAFGACVYLRMRHARVEHPGTGRWVGQKDLETWLHSKDVDVISTRSEGDFTGWAIVKTQALLDTGTVLLYLPRDWNTHGKWITRDQLQVMYDKYKKEVDQCLTT